MGVSAADMPQASHEEGKRDAVRDSANEADMKHAANDATAPVADSLDADALARIARARAADRDAVEKQLGLNAVEPNIEREQQKLDAEQDAKRSAWLNKAQPTPQAAPAAASGGSNEVIDNEPLAATQSDVRPIVPADVEQDYVRVGDKFYHPKNTSQVAFEDRGNKLETQSNSEAVASSMVRIAQARGWDEIKVTGSETFRKEVWLEAAARGMEVKGYTPSEADKAELLARSRSADAGKPGATNQVEADGKFRARENDPPAGQSGTPKADAPVSANQRKAESFNKDAGEAVKQYPELAGAAAAMAAIEKQTGKDGLTADQRQIVMARVKQNVVNSIERGQVPEVKIKEQQEVARQVNEEKEQTR